MTVVATIEAGVTHPAVRAWMRLGNRVTPARIEQFKAKKTSSVYRLVGVDGGMSVVAKRRSREAASGLMIEQTMYNDVLPEMGLPSLRSLGIVDDDDDGSTWLFVADGGARRYAPESLAERMALGAWLGVLHTKGTVAAEGLDLPDRGPAPFRVHLADGRATVMKHRGNPALDDSEQAILTDLLGLVDLVDSRWGEVESFCASMPRVLVHGDLIARNVCMRFDGGAPLVLAIDWEKAGWGIPSIDLAQAPVPSPQFSADADVVSYCDVVRSTWPRMDREMLEHSAWYATIFRCLSALHWDARYLRLDWPHRTMAKVEYYRSALRMACERAGLGVD